VAIGILQTPEVAEAAARYLRSEPAISLGPRVAPVPAPIPDAVIALAARDDLSMRSRARKLAEELDVSEEAAMSKLRRYKTRMARQ
jgi:hypothetical protein